MSLNRVCLSGRLTRDTELKYTQTGTAVASNAIAVNRNMKNQETGEYDADFFNLTAWQRTAEFMNNHVGKGCRVNIEGRLQQRKWVDQQSGQQRSVIEVVVENIEPIDWKKDSEEGEEEDDSFADSPAPQRAAPAAQSRPSRRAEPQPAPVEDYEDEDTVDPFAEDEDAPVPVQTEKHQPARRQPVGANR